jgi:hypothetical protein
VYALYCRARRLLHKLGNESQPCVVRPISARGTVQSVGGSARTSAPLGRLEASQWVSQPDRLAN